MTDRELDIEIAKQVLGLREQIIKPEWYRFDVHLFYREGSDLIEYSYDRNACNAVMRRNGKDETDGNADCLPHFTEELTSAMEALRALHARKPEIAAQVAAAIPTWTWTLPEHEAAYRVCELMLNAVTA